MREGDRLMSLVLKILLTVHLWEKRAWSRVLLNNKEGGPTMQRKMRHWLTRAAFLPLSVALGVEASLAAAGMPQRAQYTPLATTTSRTSDAGQVLLVQATPRAHPLGA